MAVGGINDLECSMDGMVLMVKKGSENLLLPLSLLKETFAYLLPVEMMQSVQLLWDGTMGLASWVGYAMAALYYLGTDYEFGLIVCEVFAYGYLIIDGINYIVDFAAPALEAASGEDGGIDLGGLLSGAGVGGLLDSVSGITDALGVELPDELTGALDMASGLVADGALDGVLDIASDIVNANIDGGEAVNEAA